MADHKDNVFKNFIKYLWRGRKEQTPPRNQSPHRPQETVKQTAPVQKPENVAYKSAKIGQKTEKVYKTDQPLNRRLLLWGFNKAKEPTFLILHGKHKLTLNKNGEFILEPEVTYTGYSIHEGCSGHFPSFEALKILDIRDYRNNTSQRNMFYNKDIRGTGYWQHANNTDAVHFYHNLRKKNQIKLPYHPDLTSADYGKMCLTRGISFPGFHIADNPMVVLNLRGDIKPYYDDLIAVYSNQKLYMRKKALAALIQKNPPEALYEYMFFTGSSELISGLLLDLGKERNPVLLKLVPGIFQKEIDWVSTSYGEGIKRCAMIYYHTFDEKAMSVRKEMIEKDLHEMELEIKNYYGQGRSLYDRPLDVLHIKNMIQEGEAYGFASIIGTIACKMDTRGLPAYFYTHGNTKGLDYFRKKLRREMDYYAEKRPEMFIEAMKALFTGYDDSGYRNQYNFQMNYYIKHYLYHDYEPRPQDLSNWSGEAQRDPYLAVSGRYDVAGSVWDNHLADVLIVASQAKVRVIIKAFYAILADPKNQEALALIPAKDFIDAAGSTYEPLAALAIDRLRAKMDGNEPIDESIMIELLKSNNTNMRQLAYGYFLKAGHLLQPEKLILYLDASADERFIDFLSAILTNYSMDQYSAFLQLVFEMGLDHQEVLNMNDGILKTLKDSSHKMLTAGATENIQLINMILNIAENHQRVSALINEFLEIALFQMPYDDLKAILNQVKMPETMKSMNQTVFALCTGITSEKPPENGQIAHILDQASPDVLKTLYQLLNRTKEQISGNFSLLVMLSECGMAPLSELSESIVMKADKDDQMKLIFMFLNSPVAKTYQFAIEKLQILYEDQNETIPAPYLMDLLEHPSYEVKTFITKKIRDIIDTLGGGNEDIFVYYAKTLLYLPNKSAIGKEHIYQALPEFTKKHRDKTSDILEILTDLGGSNIINDSEQALMALAKIQREAV